MSSPITTDPMRIAAIDVGSNTIKMLAAQICAAGFSVLKWQSVTVRLQSGLLPDGSLDEAALQRAEDAIVTLAAAARELGASRIEAFGTSALRDAKNADVLIRRVQKKCNVPLIVISGEEEAESAYAAAAPMGRAMVVNPGGGSTEMIIGENAKPLCAVSAHIGAVSLMKQAQGLSPLETQALARSYLEPEWKKLNVPMPETVIASGGAAACVADVLLALPEHDPAAVEGYVLTRENAASLLEKLFPMSFEERCRMPGMKVQRADILPYGLAILTAFMDLSGAPALTISDRGNLYGFIKRMMAN